MSPDFTASINELLKFCGIFAPVCPTPYPKLGLILGSYGIYLGIPKLGSDKIDCLAINSYLLMPVY